MLDRAQEGPIELHDIEDPAMKARILQANPNISNEQLLVESLLGKGTIISPVVRNIISAVAARS